MALEPKYVVIKVDDWKRFTGEVNELLARVEVPTAMREESRRRVAGLPIKKGFFVIVEGDVFAPSGVVAYASAILGGLDTAKSLGVDFDPDTEERFIDLSESLVGEAHKWQAGPQKLPD